MGLCAKMDNGDDVMMSLQLKDFTFVVSGTHEQIFPRSHSHGMAWFILNFDDGGVHPPAVSIPSFISWLFLVEDIIMGAMDVYPPL